MKTHCVNERRTDAESSPTVVTVRTVDNAVDAETLLPVSVLNRLGANDVPSRIRQCNVYLSQVVVALDGESAVGFAAFKTTSGSVRVAHEFWVDPHARAGLTPVTEAMLAVLEAAVSQAGCSRLFVVTVRSEPAVSEPPDTPHRHEREPVDDLEPEEEPDRYGMRRLNPKDGNDEVLAS